MSTRAVEHSALGFCAGLGFIDFRLVQVQHTDNRSLLDDAIYYLATNQPGCQLLLLFKAVSLKGDELE